MRDSPEVEDETPADSESPGQAARPAGWSQRPGSGPVTSRRGRAGKAGFWTAIGLGAVGGLVLALGPSWDDFVARWQSPERGIRATAHGSDAGLGEPASTPTPKSEPAPARPTSPDAGPGGTRYLSDRELDDAQLLELFALEPRARQPSCDELAGGSAARPQKRDPRKSRARLRAARRRLASGDHDGAHRLVCRAIAHDPGSPQAWRALAELALQRGDADQAGQALERALEEKPHDRKLLGILGDAWALRGDLERSRTLWRQSAKMGGQGALRERLLAELFANVGDRELRGSNAGSALSHYRRAVVLSAGAEGPSLGMSKALVRLDRDRAAQAWDERTRRAFARGSSQVSAVGDGARQSPTPLQAAPGR